MTTGGGRWFKLNTTWSSSPWLAELPPAARLAWVELIGYVKAHGFDGKARALAPSIFGRQTGIPTPDVVAMLDAATADGALELEDGCWRMTGWLEHQGDRTAADRMRRYRNTDVVTPVTRNDRSVTPRKRREGEREEEKKDSLSESPKKRRATALPDGWTPTPAHAAIAADRHVDLDLEADKLRDWAISKGEARIDWDATFRNWLRNAKPAANGHPSDISPADARLIRHRQRIDAIDLDASRTVFDA
jgi:hypothetical protein